MESHEAAVDGDGDTATELKQQATTTPITNAILSQAVTSAISQLDTKRAFDMMLLNEQMSALEAENKCLKDEAAFLRESLAKRTQETSEMYHYFHGKMDSHVAAIARLESELAAANLELERFKEVHVAELTDAQSLAEYQLSQAKADADRLREELQQLNAFSMQKKQMEELIQELQDELETKGSQFTAEKNELELKAMFEKDRVKKDMLSHMKETKEALLLRTDDQLNTTTKRTMMENDHFMEELSFQSRETEKLLMRFRQVEEEVQRLRVKNKVLEENEVAMAKKNHYYQKILGHLKKQTTDPPKHTDMDTEDTAATEAERKKWAKTVEEGEHLKARVTDVEESLRHAQQWIRAYQHERQFVIAQQDEIIQFLCRALSEAAHDLASQGKPLPRSGDAFGEFDCQVGLQARALPPFESEKMVTSMEELVSCLPPISLDELSTDETRFVLGVLLEKMRTYQQQVAVIYRGEKVSPTSPSLAGKGVLSKQLGVELPPIVPPAASCVTSPLKVKRRIQPYTAATANASRPPPANQDGSAAKIRVPSDSTVSAASAATSPNNLLRMATSSFNFLQPTPTPSSLRSPTATKKPSEAVPAATSSPTKYPPMKKADASTRVKAERSTTGGDNDKDRNDLDLQSSFADLGLQPSAWSTDSLPKFEGSTDDPPPGDAPPQQQLAPSQKPIVGGARAKKKA